MTERGRGVGDLVRSLGAHDRVTAIGIAVVALSLLLPWYGLTFPSGFVKTPVGSFGFVEAAILLMLVAVAYLIVRGSRAEPLPRPLHIGTLMAAAGAWTALLVAYRILDRPDFEPFDSARVGLRYGVFVALGGAALIVIGGLRRRRDELAAEASKESEARRKPEVGKKVGE